MTFLYNCFCICRACSGASSLMNANYSMTFLYYLTIRVLRRSPVVVFILTLSTQLWVYLFFFFPYIKFIVLCTGILNFLFCFNLSWSFVEVYNYSCILIAQINGFNWHFCLCLHCENSFYTV